MLDFLSVVAAQVTITADAWADIGTDTTLRCQTQHTVRRIKWGNSSFTATEFEFKNFVLFTVDTNEVLIRDESHYVFDKDDPTYPVTIKTLTLEDEARYWCQVYGAGIGYRSDSVIIRIRGMTSLHFYLRLPEQ